MSARIITGTDDSGREVACFFCGTTDTVFGPIFRGGIEEAEAFEAWLADKPPRLQTRGYNRRPAGDPRSYIDGELESLWRQFCKEREAANG